MLVLLFALALLFYMNVGHLLQLHAIGSDSPKTTPPATEPKVVNDHDPATKAWSYNFSDYPEGALPSKDWRFETGTAVADYHHELQSYTSSTSNVRIEGGVLVIEARQKNLNGRQFTSGRISTLDNFSFTYGSLEVDMMLPEGTGTWPAAWLMPRDNVYKKEMFGLAQDDKLAWALNGEIDFGEAIGSLPGQNIPAAHSYNELHQAPTYTPAYVPNPYTQYHRYGVIKTPDKITFTLDGKPYATRQKTSDSPLDWPFNQPYYLILNLAIGGDWAGDEGVDISFAPWRLQVKSISYKPL
jgi:beta-glucanase (GH16 family)